MSHRHGSQLPRPWYISLTAVWQDDEENYPKLNKLLTQTIQQDNEGNDSRRNASVMEKPRRPGHHVFMPELCRHFTVLAIMKLNGHSHETQSMRQFARCVFKQVRTHDDLPSKLRAWFKPFTATVTEVRCYDDGITLQFECGDELEHFRDHARKLLKKHVSELVREYTNNAAGLRFRIESGRELVESILRDPSKNYGTGAFGSVARSPCRFDGSTQRWCVKLRERGKVTLEFKKIHLLVSDEMLTNPRSDEEDVPISPLPPRRRRAGDNGRVARRRARRPRHRRTRS